MINASALLEKKLLQATVGIACLVPLLAGLAGALAGTDFMGSHASIDLDSHFHYLSGLLLGIGICFISTIPGIEHKTMRFRLLTFIVATGGIARLVGVFADGIPSTSMLAALGMELGVTPLLCLWQYRIARKLGF